ncbi:hypothetical protein POX_d05860 [Penicillium oxalicum]|uniref:Uncharacterized protein n=1 Tax=Penicillium oxalicum (strain 114-2 / CGMCC 5302) TaxID=933388 RepID=S7ZMS7_PENO1|nr:hypothetical protein POX_d05860 [Penicillium oxalicum]EPS31960.1 hypothetical protein PDE_06919 [Penicillium oxalicum 114-2]KAI2790350.1 hypothetical protein POX_d05860 [Penicillium oxalicum]
MMILTQGFPSKRLRCPLRAKTLSRPSASLHTFFSSSTHPLSPLQFSHPSFILCFFFDSVSTTSIPSETSSSGSPRAVAERYRPTLFRVDIPLAVFSNLHCAVAVVKVTAYRESLAYLTSLLLHLDPTTRPFSARATPISHPPPCIALWLFPIAGASELYSLDRSSPAVDLRFSSDIVAWI